MPAVNDEEGSLYYTRPKKVTLDERLLDLFLTETAQDRLEAQELRQIVHQALQDLTPEELRIIELRYQHKKSPGQVASQLQIPREEMQQLEKNGLEKLRQHLQAWRAED
ncbi:MAG: sigma-70 family RNA polymerase sigma factor [Gemmatimonadetes bacterium]|jgi:RNA polymerase sigma factor (sigma-70 family)|nr:sigma-70 family RNA polymerase sigma factor [Gemmatimonadota bacterium]